jgi:hypothetical protein
MSLDLSRDGEADGAHLSLFPGLYRLERPAPVGKGIDGDERQRRDQHEGCDARTAAPSRRPTSGVCCRADDDDKEVEYFAKSLLVLLHTLQRELLVIGRGFLCWEKESPHSDIRLAM